MFSHCLCKTGIAIFILLLGQPSLSEINPDSLYRQSYQAIVTDSDYTRALSIIQAYNSMTESTMLARGKVMEGYIYSQMDDAINAAIAYNKATDLYLEAREYVNAAKTCNRLGILYYHAYAPRLSVTKYRAGLVMVRGTNNDIIKAILNYQMGKAYQRANMFDSAFLRYQYAFDVYAGFGWVNHQIDILLNRGVIYEKSREYEKAIDHYETVLMMAAKAGTRQTEREIEAYNNLGNVALRMANYDLAQKHLDAAARLLDKRPIDRLDMLVQFNYGKLYCDLHEPLKALGYFKRSISINSLHEEKLQLTQTYVRVISIFKGAGQYDSALYYSEELAGLLQTYQDAADSLTIISKQAETRIAEQQIANEKLALQQRKERKRFILMILISIITLVALVTLGYKYKIAGRILRGIRSKNNHITEVNAHLRTEVSRQQRQIDTYERVIK